jgi:endonuclease G, mitochondrial
MAKKKTPPKKHRQKRTKKVEKGQADKLSIYRDFIRAHADDYLKDENITSLGIGYKTVDGKPTKQLAVQFSVAQKVAPEAIESLATEKIPKTILFQGVEIPTDVVQRSFEPSYVVVQAMQKGDRKVRRDPISPGVSVANCRTTAGTLGAFVRDRTSGEVVMLSNWHVLHTPTGKVGDPIVQPGPFDDNRIATNGVGKLLRSHLGAAGDCAIASIEGRKIDSNVIGIDGSVAITRIGMPQLGDRIVKSGRTTDVTFGIVSRIDTVTKLSYGEGVVANIGGFEIAPDPTKPAPSNEISKGGDSGSAWIAVAKNGKPTNIMLGLHFAGDAEGSDGEFALACYAASVFEKLEIEPITQVTPAPPKKVTIEEVTEHPEFRTGFDEEFLQFPVPTPTFIQSTSKDLAILDGSKRIDYCHFSLWLSKSRKFPRVVAWNIDGDAVRSISRTGIPFKVDERGGLEKFQIDDELYADNPFDRGHVARRADLCWGPLSEARQANRDSFFFSNITPQHARFNQGMRGGLWGQLEDAIFNDIKVANLRVSLMGGPILRSTDPEYRGLARVPREFWKLVAYTDDSDGKHKVRAFVLTQRDLVKDVVSELLELEEFRWYQVPLSRIESESGIRFAPSFKALDVLPVGPQSVGGGTARVIESSSDFFA